MEQTSVELTAEETAEWQAIQDRASELYQQLLAASGAEVRVAEEQWSEAARALVRFVHEALRRRGYDPAGHTDGQVTRSVKGGKAVLTTNAPKVMTPN